MCEKTKGSKCKRIINTTTIQAEKRDIQLILDIKNKKKTQAHDDYHHILRQQIQNIGVSSHKVKKRASYSNTNPQVKKSHILPQILGGGGGPNS